MKQIITLSFIVLLIFSTSCKKNKYIPPQDANGKICIERIDTSKRFCERNARDDYSRCKKRKGKKCTLKTNRCSTQYNQEYIRCGGQIVKE